MQTDQPKLDIRRHWESAARGWARWEPVIAKWMEPATTAMLDLAGIRPGATVLDLACGAGSQTLSAARRVGPGGRVMANDIADAMLHHVRENARAVGLTNITTLPGAAEELAVSWGSCDAVICRLGLMLFARPKAALRAMRRALRVGGRIAVVVFTTPAANPFMAESMQILLRHARKRPPPPSQPGIFALGGPGILERLFTESGFALIEQRGLAVPLRMNSPMHALRMMQEAFGAYRAVLTNRPEPVRAAAWSEVAEFLDGLVRDGAFHAPAEVLVTAAVRPRT